MRLALVDLGCANVGSVRRAFERLGASPVPTDCASEIAAADRVVLPGVGTAGFAMQRIRELGLEEVLKSLTRPVLGICLGMQLLFDSSEEQDTRCLGLLEGAVRRLVPGPGCPVPHMGWSRVVGEAPGLKSGDYFFFAHSYGATGSAQAIASVDYGEPLAAVVRSGNFIAAQFHPERSGAAGARFLEGFLCQ